jgi:hypothetical protein
LVHGRARGFLGREDELSYLAGALGGDARLVLVTGDAGVGKTAAGRDVAITACGGGIAAGVIHGDVVPPNSDR